MPLLLFLPLCSFFLPPMLLFFTPYAPFFGKNLGSRDTRIPSFFHVCIYSVALSNNQLADILPPVLEPQGNRNKPGTSNQLLRPPAVSPESTASSTKISLETNLTLVLIVVLAILATSIFFSKNASFVNIWLFYMTKKIMVLTLPPIWICRSAEITEFAKRKLSALWSSE